MVIANKIIGAATGATIYYSVYLVLALKYAKESKSVPDMITLIVPTIIGGVIGFIIS
jgi:hypothetical protein